jgi:hypothetical protein
LDVASWVGVDRFKERASEGGTCFERLDVVTPDAPRAGDFDCVATDVWLHCVYPRGEHRDAPADINRDVGAYQEPRGFAGVWVRIVREGANEA